MLKKSDKKRFPRTFRTLLERFSSIQYNSVNLFSSPTNIRFFVKSIQRFGGHSAVSKTCISIDAIICCCWGETVNRKKKGYFFPYNPSFIQTIKTCQQPKPHPICFFWVSSPQKCRLIMSRNRFPSFKKIQQSLQEILTHDTLLLLPSGLTTIHTQLINSWTICFPHGMTQEAKSKKKTPSQK